jgi:uncharacterized cupredoxin-like copper-binding protein
MDRRRVEVLMLVVLLAVGALALPVDAKPLPATNSIHTAATGSITVAATMDYGYEPDLIEQTPVNATITVTFTDNDPANMAHSFNISSREGFVIPTSYTAAQLNQLFTTYPALYAATVNALGDQSVGKFQSPTTPGWYEFVCNVSGHFQDGMYGFIAFGENLPSNLTPPARTGVGGGLTFSPLDAAVIAVVVLALAIGYFLWSRRRSARRIPPAPRLRTDDRPTQPRPQEDGLGKRAG